MKNSFPPIVLETLEGISDVKGENTVVLDLRHLDNAVCDYFVITEAQSSTQVSALSSSVEKRLREQCDERPWHIEGSQESEWILMDYVHVVVHIFQREARTFYDIEGLWGDATYTAIPS
jgi:ribosome-associated protein